MCLSDRAYGSTPLCTPGTDNRRIWWNRVAGCELSPLYNCHSRTRTTTYRNSSPLHSTICASAQSGGRIYDFSCPSGATLASHFRIKTASWGLTQPSSLGIIHLYSVVKVV